MTTKSKQKSGHVNVEVVQSARGFADKTSVAEFLLQALDVGENPASVNVAVSLTHNLGNYESLRVSVGVTLPSRPTNIYQSGEAAKRIAHDVFDRMMDEWVGAGTGRRSPQPESVNDDPDFQD